MLLATAEVGGELPRRPAETPAEYQARLDLFLSRAAIGEAARSADGHLHQPTDAEILEELTGAYERERYGGKRTGESIRNRLLAGVPQLLKRFIRDGTTR